MELHPELARIRAGAEAIACRPVRMSGSGSTLFVALGQAAHAAALADELAGALAGVGAGLRVLCTRSADAIVGSRVPVTVAD